MNFEKTRVWGFEHAFRGMRNPKNSWHLSDSHLDDSECHFPNGAMECVDCEYFDGYDVPCKPLVGPKDLKLAQTLIKGGSEHRKFLRQIFVSVDITAPLFWWSEYDTYKVGTTANSTSKMHTIHTKPISLDCFETGDFHGELDMIDDVNLGVRTDCFIDDLEQLRQLYLRYKDTDKKLAKKYWKELIRWLPESWLQTRTVTLTYENIFSMVRQRNNHKLNEWSGKDNPELSNFIAWVKTLPLADELIFLNEPKQHPHTKVVCISGQARAGKDTTARMIEKELTDKWNKQVLVLHNGDLLKFMCMALFGWNGQKDEEGRHLLQYVGTDIIRKQEPDFWVGFIVKVLKLFPEEWDYVLIPDVRFPNEINELKKADFDVTHVHVTRPVENDLTEEQKNHPSETALRGVIPDKTIENNGGIDELRQQIEELTCRWFSDVQEGSHV